MKNYSDDNIVTLSKSPLGMVQRCRCGGYHINIQHVTLHLSVEGFGGLDNLIQQAKEREWENAFFANYQNSNGETGP